MYFYLDPHKTGPNCEIWSKLQNLQKHFSAKRKIVISLELNGTSFNDIYLHFINFNGSE